MSSARPIPDAAARTRIVTELDRNLIVEAGAGSGKTQKLAERMAAGIATGVYELDGLAAVTFTRKAAAELRGRFQLALEAELATGGADDRQERLRAALSNLERFFAGTIHSFCARLLRERPVEAGVSPGFTELNDVEERLVREQSWRDYRSQANATGDPDLLELLDAGITAQQLDNAFMMVCLYEDVDFPAGDAPKPDAKKTWKELEKFWVALCALLPTSVNSESTCKTIERAVRFKRQWRAYERGNRDAALLADLLRSWESQPKVILKWWSTKSDAKQAEQLHAQFREDTVQPYLTSWRRYLYGSCVSLLTRARASAQMERRRRNALSFNDLLIMTATVLRKNTDVRHALQRKYRWLLVDEFQDTDPVQAEIMLLLASDPTAKGGDGTDWRSVPLRPGALFVVGDPKQSIFRFRRADIDIYNEVRARLGGPDDTGLVKLTTNFRSVPGLCTWANDVFKTHFPSVPTAKSPAFAPLEPNRASIGAPDLVVLDLPESIEPSELQQEEAKRIARYIRSEVESGRRTYGSFLILTRKKKRLRALAAALEDLHVPIEVTGAGAFDQSAEVREIALLLSALADPQDAVALVGVLRGPLFGLSDRALFAFRQAGGYLNLFAEIDAKDTTARKVCQALESLRQWFKWTRMLPAGAALERILEDSGYLALAATSPGGVEAGDLLHAIDRVRAVVERGFTLAEAANALGQWSGLDGEDSNDSTEVDSVPLEPGRRDVVRLMNLHKAKGLEADVVFLADPLGGFEPRVDVRVIRDGIQASGYFQIVGDSENPYVRKILAEPTNWEAYKDEEEAYLAAEGDRLLYVAATRAKDMLVVSRYAGTSGRRIPAWGPLSAKLTNSPVLAIPSAVATAVPQKVDLSVSTAAKAVAVSVAAHEVARQPSWSATSVTAESKGLPRFVLESANELEQEDPTRALLPNTASHRADAGMEWGTLVHGLLEHAMRHRSATSDDLRRLAVWLTMEHQQLRPVIDLAAATAMSATESPELRAARTSRECHEEVPFSFRDTSTSVPTVVTGAIDLVHQTTDGWQVIDYKTDVDLADEAAQKKYGDQLEDYAKAWSRVSGKDARSAIVAARRPDDSTNS